MPLVKRKTGFGSTMLWVPFGSLLSSFGVHGWCSCVVA
jgi:hypothetical protein